jgi:hypothetical protein
LAKAAIRSTLASLASLALLLPACGRTYPRYSGEGDNTGGNDGYVGHGGSSGGYAGGHAGGYAGRGGQDGYAGYGYPTAGYGYAGYGYPTAGYGYAGYGYAGYGYAGYGYAGYGYPTAGYGGSGTWCGDGIIGPYEECDGMNLGGATCSALGFFGGGFLRCYPGSCTFDVSGCLEPPPPPQFCGDGIIDQGEQCEATNLGWASCVSLGYDGGWLECYPETCTFDTRGCFECGNGRIDQGEQCDGRELGGQSCLSLGYIGGALRCYPYSCDFDVSGCAVCGDGVVQAGENCDGPYLQGHSCSSLGLGTGILRCDPSVCLYDTSGCSMSSGPFCGNGVAERGEQCDGRDLLNATCEHLGYDGGQLQCNSSTCRYNTSACIRDEPPPNEACTRCIDQNCAEAIENCMSDPACVAGIDCIVPSCGPEADVMCALDCFGGIGAGMVPAQKAVTMNTCIFSLCGEACLGQR